MSFAPHLQAPKKEKLPLIEAHNTSDYLPQIFFGQRPIRLFRSSENPEELARKKNLEHDSKDCERRFRFDLDTEILLNRRMVEFIEN